MSFGPLRGEPEVVLTGVPCGVWKGVEVGVEASAEGLVRTEEDVLVVLERMRVVLVP